jgi:transposase
MVEWAKIRPLTILNLTLKDSPMYQNFIGIDIGKNSVVVALHGKNEVQTFSNDSSGFRSLLKYYQSFLVNSLVILETTGGYELELIDVLEKENIAVHRAHTLKVKHYIRSFGTLAKCDSVDAKALARYGADRYADLELYKENNRKLLQKLVERRNDLKQMLVQEKNRMQSPGQTSIHTSFEVIIKALKQELKNISQQIEEYIEKDSELSQQRKVLETISGIGKVVSFELLAFMPELGLLNRRKIASLAGLAPHPYESGKKIGYRNMRGGRGAVKNILFMAALTASRSKSKLGNFYQTLVARGKLKMVAIGALMRKILVIANAKMKELFTLKKIPQHG